MSKTPAPVKPFEPEFIAGLKSIFEEKIVFNQVSSVPGWTPWAGWP